ncbi:MAG: glycosyltransferase family 2 protein [Alcanivorax sp.]
MPQSGPWLSGFRRWPCFILLFEYGFRVLNIKLSIIIPNYNGVKFLYSCLCSVLAQAENDCEVILVDDGSTDASVELVQREFSDEIARRQLKVICIENSGPGEARNIGVRASSGEYISFLDSDDFIFSGYIDLIFKVLDECGPDIIQFNARRVAEDGLTNKKLLRCHRSPEGLYSLFDVRDDIFGVGRWFPGTRVFRADIAEGHPFPSARSFYEDLTTIPYVYLTDFSIYLCDKPLYAYRDNAAGTTRNHKPDHARTMLTHFERFSALPPSLPRDLMRVKVARSIMFLALELNMDEIDLGALRRQIRRLENKAALAAHLDPIDRFFLRFPLLYSAVDWGRKRLRFT